MSTFAEVDESQFEQQVLRASVPVLVEFGAAWCVPCKRLEPELEKLAFSWKDRIRLARVDVDQSLNLTMHYQIMSVPTTILFVDGQPVQRLTGFQPYNKLVEKLSPHMQAGK
ncbi:MAG TPA: thioredoxin family protein [Chloroflexi bacterium]|jgi:thioredoxin 1|nr:thioredoxin family protein [Chloroflexota bacterium]